MLKKLSAVAISLILAGCGSDSDNGNTTETITYNSPVIEFVSVEDNLNVLEGESVDLNYNIVDPDSSVFNLSLTLKTTNSDGTISQVSTNIPSDTTTMTINDLGFGSIYYDSRKTGIEYTAPRTVGDKTIELTISAEDETNLIDTDTLNITVKENINNTPSIQLSLENNILIENEDLLKFNIFVNDTDEDQVTLNYNISTFNQEDCLLQSCTKEVLGTEIISKNDLNKTLSKEFEYNSEFFEPEKSYWLSISSTDGFLETIVEKEFFIKKKEENLLPVIEIESLNGFNTLDSIEVLETDLIDLTVSIDSMVGEVDSYNINISPNIVSENNIVETPIIIPVIVNDSTKSTGTINYKIDNLNIEGDTETNINIHLYNKYGYRNELNIPVTVLENVVRAYETLEQDYNNTVYQYASYKIVKDEEIINNLYLDYLVLKRLITLEEKETYIEEFEIAKIQENLIIENLIANIYNEFNKESPDYAIAFNDYIQLEDLVKNYGISLIEKINTLSTLDLYNNLPQLVETLIQENNASHSRFIGDSNFGFWTNDQSTTWVFNEKYKLIEAITSPLTQQCVE